MMGGGFEVFKSGYVGKEIIFFCEDDKGILSSYVLLETTICGINGYIGRRSWTRIDQRRKGIGSDLFVFIHKYLKKSIFTDEAQTPSSRALWASLSKRYSIKVLDTLTKEVYSKSDRIDDVYTDDPQKSADRLMMIEANQTSIIPERSEELNRLLTPYRLFEKGDE